MLLEIKNITVYYSKSMAISDVSVNVPEGEIVSIIGANGAGKSTILHHIEGFDGIGSYQRRRNIFPGTENKWIGNARDSQKRHRPGA